MASGISKPIFVLNGPNLNMLGQREPGIYGAQTLADVEAECIAHGKANGFEVVCHQSNHEGDLIGWIQEAGRSGCGVAMNAGAYTHTSIGIYDAIKSVDVPVVELHISNVHARESFRHHSMIAAACLGVICGFGTQGYTLALRALADHLQN